MWAWACRRCSADRSSSCCHDWKKVFRTRNEPRVCEKGIEEARSWQRIHGRAPGCPTALFSRGNFSFFPPLRRIVLKHKFQGEESYREVESHLVLSWVFFSASESEVIRWKSSGATSKALRVTRAPLPSFRLQREKLERLKMEHTAFDVRVCS
jgi:hypothetical protein